MWLPKLCLPGLSSEGLGNIPTRGLFRVSPVADFDPAFGTVDGKTPLKRGRQDCTDHGIGASRKGHHDSKRVTIFKCRPPCGQSSPHSLGATQNGDRQIHQMNSGCGQWSHRREALRQSPIVRRQCKKFILTEISFNLKNGSDSPTCDVLAQVDESGLESTLVSNPQYKLTPTAFSNSTLCVRQGQAQRLFAKHMLARLCRLNDLLGVE